MKKKDFRNTVKIYEIKDIQSILTNTQRKKIHIIIHYAIEIISYTPSTFSAPPLAGGTPFLLNKKIVNLRHFCRINIQ